MTEADSSRPSPQPDWPITDDAIREVFAAMLHDGSWGRYHGPHCSQLQTALAEFHSVDHVTLCSSGTSAIELALRAAQVQPGDEVILAAYDYKANFANVLSIGAIPVLVDTFAGLPILDPAQLREATTERTKAIICSHLHGCFAHIDAILSFARERQLTVIEDACQATGGVLNGRVVGSIGDIGLLSFGGSKLMTAGRGGAILTNDATLAQRIRLYTQRGNDAYPLSEMQAAVLLPQLTKLPGRNATRLYCVGSLVGLLEENANIEPALDPLPGNADSSAPAYYKVALRYVAKGITRQSCQDFADSCRDQGVALDPAFPSLNQVHSSRRFRAIGDLANANKLHECLMTLHHPVLLNSKAMPEIAAVLGH